MAILEFTVVLVNVSMKVVWLNDVHLAEVVSWCGVASHPVVEQHLWLQTAHLQASDIVTKSYGLTSFHLCSNVTPRCNRITLTRMSRGLSPTFDSEQCECAALACNITGIVTWGMRCSDGYMASKISSWRYLTMCACQNLEWYSAGILQNTCYMQRHCQACIDSNGGHTRYWWAELCLENVSENWSLSKMQLIQ